MCRRMNPCIQREPKHHHSLTCFSALSLHSYEPERHETPKLERRATLCPKCEAKGEDGKVYVNGTRRASAPPFEAGRESKSAQQGEKSTTTKLTHCATSIIVSSRILIHVLRHAPNHGLHRILNLIPTLVSYHHGILALGLVAVQGTAQRT
ncbi:hypothetical protein MKX07_001797 [Trichoderma sp. CBMAI-0711]|nr:hypothetical protein MKX07_001797 [Trichoderma sp. CBMAI-0711]